MNRFEERRILITGGTNGMGLAAAKMLLAEGAKVALTGINPKRLAAVATTFKKPHLVLENNAAKADTGQQLAAAVANWGTLDGLWLNAGVAVLDDVAKVDCQSFDRIMHTNVRGPMLQLSALLPYLKDGASVVLTSSSSAYEGAAATALYGAAKAGVIALAKSWVSALAPKRIRVNVLVPGPIATGFRDFLDDDVKAQFEASVLNEVPLARVGHAEEAASAALFLLSEQASYITGSQLPVDGGLLMR
ncbi:SDR family oxidoreductase [Gallaecimonas mangrovi]|uniref:SDR family oxidoreductase n=1 Tax=Gallaecimonas mangrovi TaxID=2291597 RepID=UPI000E202E22|nr:SDR family oxidoreductase [Gallaecimonas mangrovi]